MTNVIRQAIERKKIISFTYGGYLRIVEPHILGKNNSVIQVLCYQIDGHSSSGGLPEWRRFDLPRISNLAIMEQSFPGPRPSSGERSSWDQIIIIVS